MDGANKAEFIRKMGKLKRLYDAYLDEWRQELEAIQKKKDNWTLEDTTNLQMIVHKLTGTGSTFGYSEITDTARALEYKLAYANIEFKAGINPNQNYLIVTELARLIYICSAIHGQNEMARLEREMYGDEEADDIMESQVIHDRNKTIMIVDDQKVICDTLGAGLRAAGFNVIAVNDGDDALLIMRQKKPDLVVLDRMMPNLDGMSVLRTMRKVKDLQDMKVIFLTALYTSEDVIEAEKLNAVGYVAKPVDVDEFVLRCVRILQDA